jgi:hypothetical protein
LLCTKSRQAAGKRWVMSELHGDNRAWELNPESSILKDAGSANGSISKSERGSHASHTMVTLEVAWLLPRKRLLIYPGFESGDLLSMNS